jgi:anaerobic ribonucleoside-triphosphate reductase
MRKIIPALLLFCCVLALRGQTPSPDAPPAWTVAAPTSSAEDVSSKKARAALDDMIQALGGDQWLNYQNSYVEGRIAGFFQGKPTGATVRYWDWRTLDAERIDLTEGKSDKHNWSQIFTGRNCWEITFRGKNPIPKDQCAEAIRRRDHSIEAAVHVWMKDPSTILMYEGQSLAERHLAQQVTLLNSDNDSITIQIDAMTHLPLRRTYYWRDPLYKDKNEETEEYDDYHNIDGIQTPFTITRLHNDDMTSQRFIFKAAYNVTMAADAFDADAAAAKIHK